MWWVWSSEGGHVCTGGYVAVSVCVYVTKHECLCLALYVQDFAQVVVCVCAHLYLFQ